MPAPSPGLKRVPRWRTMISPPVTLWPANTFTPRRLAFESRPLREEPSPFLWAMVSAPHLRDPDPGELLAVAGAPPVAALRLELHHAELRPALVPDDLGPNRAAVGELVADRDKRLEVDGLAGVRAQALDEQGLPLFDAVLLAAGLDDRVGHLEGVQDSGGPAPTRPPRSRGNGAGRPAGRGAGRPPRRRCPRPGHLRARRRPRARPSRRCGPPPRCERASSRRRTVRRPARRRCSRR